MNKKLEQAGLPVFPFSMHLAFIGEPGTGKTEIAHIYGKILREEGLLSEGRVITVSGAGGWDMEGIFESAKGSVIFIDEAYGLVQGPSQRITELIALMEERRDETVVIMAGYENEINRLLDSNPGFRSRLGFTLHFPNYSTEEQLRIFELMASRAKLVLPQETRNAVAAMIARGGKRDDQGNARFVRKLFEDSVGAQQVRLAQHEPKKGYTIKMLQTVLPEDIGYRASIKNKKSARQQLEELIGLEKVKTVVRERINYMAMNKVKRDAGLPTIHLPMHMAFKGNPGTGKTEVARLIGQILKEEGILSVGDFYECGRQDLVGPFVGTTAPKIEALFRRAKGSIIFIDEAYSLNDNQTGGFGDEAITTIIDQMEKMREDVVVIFAGYTREIDQLFSKNPGFISRIGTQIEFPDYSLEQLETIFRLMAKRQGLYISRGVIGKVQEILSSASTQENFGNARYVRNLLESALMAQSTRLTEERNSGAELSAKELTTLKSEDFSGRTDTESSSPHVPIGFAV